MRISGGRQEAGIPVGNAFDKYGSRNPAVRLLMGGFSAAVADLVREVNPASIHEVGCGEGYWTLRFARQGIPSRGSDFSRVVIDLARANAAAQGLPADIFTARSVYELDPARDAAELVLCLEVLEHLERPEEGLRALQAVAAPHLLLSVPREPLWSAMNMARGRYWRSRGNTPGHVQRWSRRGFVDLVSRFFDVREVRTPLPWTVLLARRRTH